MYSNSWYQERIKDLQENQINMPCKNEKIIYNRSEVAFNFIYNY